MGSETNPQGRVREASLERDESGGLKPASEGWFVVNVAEAAGRRTEQLGSWCSFESDANRFEEFGINVHVLEPGKPNCMYHREDAQEAFLVLGGECILIVEGQERPLRSGDFFHCPPDTGHVFVGASDRPCTILMVGGRTRDWQGNDGGYPVDDTAARYGASVAEYTSEPKVAYAHVDDSTPTTIAWPPA